MRVPSTRLSVMLSRVRKSLRCTAMICALTSSASAASLPELTGIWKPLNSDDDRLFTIKQDHPATITIDARELHCSLTDVQPSLTDGPNAIVADSVCFAEGN